MLGALLLAGAVSGTPIQASLARGAVFASVVARAEEDARLRVVERQLFVVTVENEATRLIADGTAADILSGGADIATTGWGIATGTAEESNTLLGGSRNSALVIVGTKAILLVGTYTVRRKQLGAWKACLVADFDAGNTSLESFQRGSYGRCTQAGTMKKMTFWATLLRSGVAITNGVLVAKHDKAVTP